MSESPCANIVFLLYKILAYYPLPIIQTVPFIACALSTLALILRGNNVDIPTYRSINRRSHCLGLRTGSARGEMGRMGRGEGRFLGRCDPVFAVLAS